MKRAVVIGLTNVDSSAYGGWDGECPGCDKDALRNIDMLQRESFDETKLLLNREATKEAVWQAARAGLDATGPDDLLYIYFSGHGGQRFDLDNDEDDGKDETICCYDGEIVDDDLRALWPLARTGARIVFVTDSCNSGTNYKGRRYHMPAGFRRKPVSFSRTIVRDSSGVNFAGQLIHFGGCNDGASSYGGDDGGAFTNAMLDILDSKRGRGFWDRIRMALFGPSAIVNPSYVELFDEIKKRMPRNQRPSYAEYGAVGPEFRNSPFLS